MKGIDIENSQKNLPLLEDDEIKNSSLLLKRKKKELKKDDQINKVIIVDNKMMILKSHYPWKCTFEGCDKKFKFRCRLQKHEITHSEEVIEK
jgi:hypothetical protein